MTDLVQAGELWALRPGERTELAVIAEVLETELRVWPADVGAGIGLRTYHAGLATRLTVRTQDATTVDATELGERIGPLWSEARTGMLLRACDSANLILQ